MQNVGLAIRARAFGVEANAASTTRMAAAELRMDYPLSKRVGDWEDVKSARGADGPRHEYAPRLGEAGSINIDLDGVALCRGAGVASSVESHSLRT